MFTFLKIFDKICIAAEVILLGYMIYDSFYKAYLASLKGWTYNTNTAIAIGVFWILMLFWCIKREIKKSKRGNNESI